MLTLHKIHEVPMSPTLLAILFGGVAAYFLGKEVISRLFTVDAAVVGRRRAASSLAGTLKTYGLDRLPAILNDYSVGDFVGMYDKIHEFAVVTGASEKAVLDEFEQVFTNVLNAKLNTADGRALIAAKLAGAAPVVDPVAAAAAALKAPIAA
jgi:hypothetical protein